MTMHDSERQFRKLLIISGGGIYGMIPCKFMSAADEDSLSRIDAFGGTSIGGIISLHLALHGNPKKLLSDFNDNVRDFFRRGIINRISPFSPKYRSKEMEEALKRIIPGTVADCERKFVVPSLNFKRMSPVIFQNFDASYEQLELWKIARATSAAPMYFPPFSENVLIDGGILENLPVITTASIYCKHNGISPSCLDVLAIGTGEVDQDMSLSLKTVSKYSKIQWATKLMPILTTKGNEMMSRLWGENMGFHSFQLFNPVVIDGSMDAVDKISQIEDKCEIYVGEFLKIWKEFTK